LQTAVIGTIQKLGVKADAGQFVAWAKDAGKDANLRVAAMRFLASQKAKPLDEILTAGLTDKSPTIRAEARELIAKADAKRGVKLFADVLNGEAATTAERQRAFATLPTMKTPDAEKLLDAWAAKLSGGKVAAELQLDVVEALKAAPSPVRALHRADFESKLPTDALGKWQVSLRGGDADAGREVFFNHAAAQCVRCHTARGVGGTAGPELTKVAVKNGREHVLESLILPSAKIAEGFATVTLTLADGRVLAGTLLTETKDAVTVRKPDGATVTVEAADVEKRVASSSAMPSVEKTLTPREVRDLVEYLMTLK
jgi:quinoprotein glucose dehydrogenase